MQSYEHLVSDPFSRVWSAVAIRQITLSQRLRCGSTQHGSPLDLDQNLLLVHLKLDQSLQNGLSHVIRCLIQTLAITI